MADEGNRTIPVRIAAAATAAAWVAWWVVVLRVDPATVGVVGYLLFGCTLFAAIGGTATLMGLFTRRHATDRSYATRIALRQGILLGLAVVCGVFLQSKGLLTWINMLFLVLAMTMLELFIISLQRYGSPSAHEHESSRI